MSQKNIALILIACLFAIFGFVTWANSQLIPYLKLACQLTDKESYYVASAFFAAYFFMSIPSSYILNRLGYRKGMFVGLCTMSVGAILFVPAAYAISYPAFLFALFIIGSGLALLQTASNPYVTILGPMKSAAKRISIMGICNKIAGIIAIYVLGFIALKDADKIKHQIDTLTGVAKQAILDDLASKVVVPYIVIAIVLFVFGLLVLKNMPEIHPEQETNSNDVTITTTKKYIIQYPNLVFGVIALFLYVGVEVLSYDTFSSFGVLKGYSIEASKTLASYTGYALLVGYVVGILCIPKYISQQLALVASCVMSIIFIVGAIYFEGTTAIVCFALLGFSNAAIWPAIWPLAIQGLGKFTALGSALLVMGIVGGAVLPPVFGSISEHLANPVDAYYIMLPCYFVIIIYGLWFNSRSKKVD